MSIENPQKSPNEFPERQVTSRHTTLANDGKTYDVHLLIEAANDLPVTVRPIDDFEGLKDDECWKDRRGNWIKPSDIIELAAKYQKTTGEPDWNAMALAQIRLGKHIFQVRDAEPEKYPIITYDKPLQVADGVHRLTKLWLTGKQEVSTQHLQKLPPEAVTEPEPS